MEHYTAALRQEPASDILFWCVAPHARTPRLSELPTHARRVPLLQRRSNRSLAHLEAGAPEAALRDALSATTLRPDSVKGWYRKARQSFALLSVLGLLS